MSDETTTTTSDETTNEGTESAAAGEAQKSEAFTQADVDRIVNERLKRERTKFADYDEVKTKASKLDELEESQKTELQKATDAVTQAKADATAARAELAIAQAAVKHGLSQDDLELLGSHGTAEEIDARAEKLAGRLKAAADSKPKPDFGGGDRGEDVGSKAGQLTKDDMKRMSPEEIVAASEKGQFDEILKPT